MRLRVGAGARVRDGAGVRNLFGVSDRIGFMLIVTVRV